MSDEFVADGDYLYPLGSPPLGDPGDPLSPGVHRSDDGVRYTASPAGADLGGLDFLLGRALDVQGRFFAFGGGWPNILIELNLSMTQLKPATGRELMGDALAGRGLLPVTDLVTPPEVERIRYVVRRRPRTDRPSGVFGPASDGHPLGWTLIAPLPPWTDGLDDVVAIYGHQMGVYVTTATAGLVTGGGQAMIDGMAAEADAGRLFATRAAVLP